MSIRYFVLSAVSILTTLSVLLVLTADPSTYDASGKHFSSAHYVAGSAAGPEFSSKRVAWEWEQLRDPATGRIPDGIRGKELAFAATLPDRYQANALYRSAGINVYDWQERGPWNVGGRTRAMAFDITGEDTILAGGVSGGMWRSTDRGLSWQMVTRPDQLPSVTTIAQDRRPGKTHIWYFGSGELYGNSASGGGAYWHGDGIFKSTDNGRTWFPLQSTSTQTPQSFTIRANNWRVATDPTKLDQDILYAALYGGISRSSDGGETWTNVLRPGGILARYGYCSDVAVTTEGIVYATLSSESSIRGIFRSDDGIKFTAITPPDMPATYNRIVIGTSESNPEVVYFLGETPGAGFLGQNFRGDSSWQSLWRYTYIDGDGTGDGGTWENRSANLPAFGGSNGDLFTQSGYDLHVRVKPNDVDVVFIGGTNLYRSNDGFATDEKTTWIGGFRTWKRDSNVIEEYSYPGHHADQHDVFFSPTDDDIMYTVSDGGVHMTFDCMADSIDWVSLNNGYLTTQFYTIAIDHGTPGDMTVMGGLQDNGTWRTSSTDVSVPWVRTGSSDGAYCAISNGGGHLYVSKQLGKVYRVDMNEEGDTVASTRIDPEGATGYRFINPLVLDPNDSRIMYLPIGKKLWVNSDVTAIPLYSSDPTPVGWDSLDGSDIGEDGGEITAITPTTAAPAGRVWYGTSIGRIYRMDDVTGENPTAVNVTQQNLPIGYISSIAVDPKNGDRAIIAFSNYSVISLFETIDGGETWQSVSGNLEQNPNGSGSGPSVRAISIFHRGGGTLYLAGTSTGLYSTTRLDGNNTVWVQEGSESIGNMIVDMIDTRESDGFVAIATHGRGVFSTTIGLLGVEATAGEIASAGFELRQSYPNPMTESATIGVNISGNGGPGRLRLYNTNGEVVATLFDGMIEPGVRTFTIAREVMPGERLPSGTYFYEMMIGSIRKSRTIVVR